MFKVPVECTKNLTDEQYACATVAINSHLGQNIFMSQNSVLYRFGFLISVLAVVSVSVFLLTHKTHEYMDVLSGQDWTHFSGATVTHDGVKIKPLNLELIHQDGSKAQLNPPVNVRGPHLAFSGAFEIKAGMSGMQDGASLQLYGEVPVVYDEWRQERPSFRLDVSEKRVEARVWDGSSSTPIDVRSFNVNLTGSTDLVIKRQQGNILITANGHYLGSMPDHDIFKSGTIWFGADGNDKGDGWLLRSLGARSLKKGDLRVVESPALKLNQQKTDSLRNLAALLPRKIKVGAAISYNPLFADEQYKTIAMREFNSITPEESMKAQFIHPAKDKYVFTEADNIVAIAKANNVAVHGHTLVFAKANPSWITDAPKQELQKIMTDHVTNIVGHFKGQVGSWDVVNEPLSEKDEDYGSGGLGLRQHFWEKAMGEAYIDEAFKAARAADPAAKLYINDYGIEHADKRWDAFFSLVQRLKTRGVPIDGVGFESHVYLAPDKIDTEILRSHIQALAALGLDIRISEIDVLGDDPQLQTQQYSDVLKVCLSEPSCSSYTTWGISDLYGSTTISERYPLLLGDNLLWDKDMKPRPAYSALQNVLKGSQVN